MTFGEWFKREYPQCLGDEYRSFRSSMRRAWNAAAQECLRVLEQFPKHKSRPQQEG